VPRLSADWVPLVVVETGDEPVQRHRHVQEQSWPLPSALVSSVCSAPGVPTRRSGRGHRGDRPINLLLALAGRDLDTSARDLASYNMETSSQDSVVAVADDDAHGVAFEDRQIPWGRRHDGIPAAAVRGSTWIFGPAADPEGRSPASTEVTCSRLIVAATSSRGSTAPVP
jgi:hypothetical protein